MRWLLLCVLVSGCGMTPDLWVKANKLCEKNEGIDYVFLGMGVTVMCKNGARFEEVQP